MKVGDLVKIRRELYTLGYAIDMYGLILAIEEEKDQREEKEKMDHPMIPSIYTRTHKVTLLKTNKEVPIPMYLCKEDSIDVLGRIKENK